MSLTYSLHNLAQLTGIEARTIRSYIQLGLLPGPEGAGRGSYYGPPHLERLQAILVLKTQDNLSLADIRRRFLTATADEIRSLATRGKAAPEASLPPSVGHSPLSFVRTLRHRLRDEESESPPERAEGADKARPEVRAFRSDFAEDMGPSVFAMRMEMAVESRDVDRPQRGSAQEWLRFEITPDVEVQVRGPIEPRRRAHLEKLVARFRKMVLGGQDDGSR
jgi:DNA-binding transcriptional MerR regulator